MRWMVFILCLSGCASLPKVEHKWKEFPEDAYIEKPTRLHKVMGVVRSKVNFPTLDPDHDEEKLCLNYFNEAVGKLVKSAKKNGGDAVIDVVSVVFLFDGRSETYPRAECFDSGGEGQVLARGRVIKWLKEPETKKNPN